MVSKTTKTYLIHSLLFISHFFPIFTHSIFPTRSHPKASEIIMLNMLKMYFYTFFNPQLISKKNYKERSSVFEIPPLHSATDFCRMKEKPARLNLPTKYKK